MKVIKFVTIDDISKDIFKRIEDKPFVAISYDIDQDKYTCHINRMSSESIVFCCNAMIKREIEYLELE